MDARLDAEGLYLTFRYFATGDYMATLGAMFRRSKGVDLDRQFARVESSEPHLALRENLLREPDPLRALHVLRFLCLDHFASISADFLFFQIFQLKANWVSIGIRLKSNANWHLNVNFANRKQIANENAIETHSIGIVLDLHDMPIGRNANCSYENTAQVASSTIL